MRQFDLARQIRSAAFSIHGAETLAQSGRDYDRIRIRNGVPVMSREGKWAWQPVPNKEPSAALPARQPATGPVPTGMTLGRALKTPVFWSLALANVACCAAHSGPIFHMVAYAADCGVAPLTAAARRLSRKSACTIACCAEESLPRFQSARRNPRSSGRAST